ncbi:MAG TPA: DNA-directed RNA polymerase subunit alpha [Rickettsiales bacterium]|nr:DNA-directed RNA polymerase subunit alpha [Rickettsiales bacterium]
MAILQENWKDMIKTSDIEIKEISKNEATLIVQPLEKGYGLTLGNAFRRILLTSIRGFAVTSVKIDGVFHEYDTIPGVREDVYDIIMNIKSLLIDKETSNSSRLFLKANKKGEVLAESIKSEGGVEILNKDLVICNIEKEGVEVNMEMTVEYGVGYKQAAFHDEKKALGMIYIDCVFSPIRRVIYKVSNARVGQKVDYDKLELTVETNGTISPADSVALAAKILQTQLDIFVNFDDSVEVGNENVETASNEINPILLKKIDEMELSVRSYNCLKMENINLIGDLVTKSEAEMLKLPNFGKKSLNELKDNLKALNLSFGMQVPNWPTPPVKASDDKETSKKKKKK